MALQFCVIIADRDVYIYQIFLIPSKKHFQLVVFQSPVKQEKHGCIKEVILTSLVFLNKGYLYLFKCFIHYVPEEIKWGDSCLGPVRRQTSHDLHKCIKSEVSIYYSPAKEQELLFSFSKRSSLLCQAITSSVFYSAAYLCKFSIIFLQFHKILNLLV